MIKSVLVASSDAEVSAGIKAYESVRRPGLARRMAHELLRCPDLGERGLVSVVIPVYGHVDPARLEMCVKSLLWQTGVSTEVIVSEQFFDLAHYRELAEACGAAYVCDRVNETANGGRFNSGRARNVGIHAARGQFVYISDCDIVYPDTHYLEKIISLMINSEDLVLVWPAMRHLAEESLEQVYSAFCAKQAWPSDDIEPVGNWAMCWRPGEAYPIAVPRYREEMHHGKQYIIRADMFDRYLERIDELSGWEPLFWLSCRHDGAICARRRHLDAVGGYAECFYQWGEEDSDLQWKLSESFYVVALVGMSGLEVVHLDHERKWFDKLMWERNKLVGGARREAGACAAILTDILENNSVFGQGLRERVSLVHEWPRADTLVSEEDVSDSGGEGT